MIRALAAAVAAATAAVAFANATPGAAAPAFTLTDLSGVWLAVNSTARTASDYAEPAAIATDLKRFDAQPARYLMDTPGGIGMAYGARTTPHMFIIDAQGKVVYNGAIDDKRSTNVDDVKTAKNYVAAALDEIRAGKPVSTPSTAPYGCSVHYR